MVKDRDSEHILSYEELLLLLSILTIPAVIYIYYIYNTTANVAYQDHHRSLIMIGRYLSGDLNFTHLWEPSSGHRAPGFSVLRILNAAYFHFNTQMEIYIGTIFLLFNCTILYVPFRKSLCATKCHTAPFFFLPIGFLIFSLIQWENIVFSDGMYSMARVTLFLISFILMDSVIKSSESLKQTVVNAVLLSLVISGIILLFGAAYSPALVLSIIIAIALNTRNNFKRCSISLCIFCFLTWISLFIYFYDIGTIVHSTTYNSSFQLRRMLLSLIPNIKFFLNTVAGSVYGNDLFHFKYFEYNIIPVIGIFTLTLYIFGAILFFYSGIHKITWIPLTLMIYSLTISAMVMVTRFDGNELYGGMASRYTTDTQCGIVGITWIVLYYLKSLDYSSLRSSSSIPRHIRSFPFLLISAAAIAFIISGYVFTNNIEWKASPYRKAFYANLVKKTIQYQHDKDDGFLHDFQAPPDLVRQGISIMRQYDLNVIYDYNRGYIQQID